MTELMRIESSVGALERLMPADRELAHANLLATAEMALAVIVQSGDPYAAATGKAYVATAAMVARQLGLSKDAQLNSTELVRRYERALGIAIRQGQARGEIRDENSGRVTVAQRERMVSPFDFATRNELMSSSRDGLDEFKRGIYALTDGVSDDQFSVALGAARSEGNVSRANVIRKIKNSALYTSDSPEWYTPTAVVESTIKLLGRIDVDPCSDPGHGVPAGTHYTVEDDGLAQAWQGTVYMNPPYGGAIGDWVRKLVAEHAAGNVTEAVTLVPARTDTQWFAQLRDWPRCFVSGRLKFSGSENSAPFPSAIIYLGERVNDFHAAFSDLGDIYTRFEAAA